jgi:hypothetical protein
MGVVPNMVVEVELGEMFQMFLEMVGVLYMVVQVVV